MRTSKCLFRSDITVLVVGSPVSSCRRILLHASGFYLSGRDIKVIETENGKMGYIFEAQPRLNMNEHE